MSNNRHYQRTRVHQRVWCEGDGRTLFVQALNASRGGLFIRTPSPSAAGKQLRLSFSDASFGDVVAEVEVMWARPAGNGGEPGMGVRILAFEQGAETYRRFVDRHLDGGSSPGMVWGPRSGREAEE